MDGWDFAKLISIIISALFVGPGMFFMLSVISKWWDLNMSSNYLENRADREIKNLKQKIRVIGLENERQQLLKKLQELNGK